MKPKPAQRRSRSAGSSSGHPPPDRPAKQKFSRQAGSGSAWILVFILVMAFALRVWGLAFGLPELYHADEPIVVNHALAYGSGDLNPHFFKIPPLVSYLLLGVYGIYFIFLRALGRVHDTGDFLNLFVSDPGSFYWLARFIFGAVCGAATVYLFYRLLKRYFSREHGLLAAFFLAVCFLHVRDSHFVYADIPLLFFLAASFFPVLRILKRPDRRCSIGFGALLGTAVATKYNGVFVVVPFLLAHVLNRQKKRNLKDLFLAGVVSLAVFGILNPYSWLDFKFFFSELFGQSHSEGFSGFLHHLTYSLNGGLGTPLLAFALAGLAAAVFADARRRVLACFVFVYYGVLIFFSQPYDRYALPLVPFMLFFAADALLFVSKKWCFPPVLLGLAAFLLALPPLAKSVLSDRLFTRTDIRALARERAEQVIPAGAKIALDVPFFMPRLNPSVRQLEEKLAEALEKQQSAQVRRLELMLSNARAGEDVRYNLYFLNKKPAGQGFLFAKPALPYDVGELKKEGIEYVFAAKIDPAFQPEFYRELKEKGILLARFNPYKDPARSWPVDSRPLTGGPFLWKELAGRERNGQIIELYKL